ncbi:hypothetical protein GGR52DRAFT_550283 [Hypoxylon sp. FL1284]|nr:hypothetical protein GGR52DRAFT_550283 [Hypoxylon sp. FL1284]
MAASIEHGHVNLAGNPLVLAQDFQSQHPERRRQHDVYGHSTVSSSQASIMSADEVPLDLSRTLTTGSEGWSDSDDADDDSSVTSATSHARISRRPHFPPVLPSVNSSSSISKSLPQKLAATISAVEGVPISKNQTKSQSPSARFRRVKSPPLPAQTQKGSLISRALRGHCPSDSQDSSDQPVTLPQRQTRQIRGIQETLSGHKSFLGSAEPRYGPHIWGSFGTDSKVSDYGDDDESGSASFDEDDDDDDDQDDMSSRTSRNFQQLAQHYSRLRDRRTTVWEIFDGIRRERTQVQDLRHVKDEAILAFMTAVQIILPEHPELDQLFKNMQDGQLRCQEAEQRFDDMIDELQQGEVELELEERRFYTAAAGIDADSSDDESDNESCSQPSGISALRGITGDRPVDIHPLFEELREAFGNWQLSKELLVNTQMKRKALSARKSHLLSPGSIELLEEYGDAGKNRALELKRVGIMTEDDIEMLRDYDSLERKAVSDIEHFREEATRLEKECREKGVMPKNTPFQQQGFGFNPVHRDDIQLGEGPFDRPVPRERPWTLAHPVFPKLLSNPTHLLDEFPKTASQSLRIAVSLPASVPSRQRYIDDAAREVNIQSLLDEAGDGDKAGYINRWLLHKLHVSPMEAELLWSTFHARLRILNIDKWQQDVLHLWWRDQAANLPATQFEGAYEDHSWASIKTRTDASFSNPPSRPHSDSGQLDHLRLREIEEAWD